MPTGYKIAGGADIDTLFLAGSGGATTSYKIAGGADLNTVLYPYRAGDPKRSATGFKIAGGADFSDRFQSSALLHTGAITIGADAPDYGLFPGEGSYATATGTGINEFLESSGTTSITFNAPLPGSPSTITVVVNGTAATFNFVAGASYSNAGAPFSFSSFAGSTFNVSVY